MCEDVVHVCSHNLWLAFPIIFARNLREIRVPGPRIFAKKFGEPRCETLAQAKGPSEPTPPVPGALSASRAEPRIGEGYPLVPHFAWYDDLSTSVCLRSTAMCVRPQSHIPVAPLNTYTFLKTCYFDLSIWFLKRTKARSPSCRMHLSSTGVDI